MTPLSRLILAVILTLPGPLAAQSTGVDMGGLAQETSRPVEVASDNLDVNQTDGTALFTGNVRVSQGEMQLSADRIRVLYAQGGGGRIDELQAEGGVTLATGAEAAEAQRAVYDIDSGQVVMEGDVLLTQGSTALSGERLTIDLTTGSGQMSGGVRTIFQTGEP